jgi:preprotein translocase subunit SecA
LEREFAEKSQKIHAVHQLLRAYALYNRDEQYIVEDGQVIIVEEFTGRKMVGRRWSEGLHQAVEAKEGVSVKGETQTLATITIQNYFRMYDKLAGMTGTAETEETEFHQIYGLEVMVIPTNRPVIRQDRHDLIYRTKREKYSRILDEIERLYQMQLPVLVGTVSVDVSETLSRMLKRRGIPHAVLNAKYHQQEAEIVAQAGQPGAVTIATNMAGRGTDIKLGPGVKDARDLDWFGSRDIDLASVPAPADPSLPGELGEQPGDFVVDEGGLHILGSERHESRRIDRQLRGRAGRQGDPGSTQFFLSLEDDLMRLFGSERIAGIMERLGAEEGEVITHPLVTRSIERAQKRVELQNFEARKRLLDYDDVMNQQREVIYDLRLFALEGGEDLKGEVWEMVEHGILAGIPEYTPEGEHPEDWDLAGLRNRLMLDYFLTLDALPQQNTPNHPFDSREAVEDLVLERARHGYGEKMKSFGEHRDLILSYILLGVIDEKWRDHLYDLDHLKASIGFRGWGQKDPLIEYKQEAYDMFVDLMDDIRKSVSSLVFRAQIGVPEPQPRRAPQRMVLSGPGQAAAPVGQVEREPLGSPAQVTSAPADRLVRGGRPLAPVGGTDVSKLRTNRGDEPQKARPTTVAEKVGRNDPCPCGSGLKYKKCHGAA